MNDVMRSATGLFLIILGSSLLSAVLGGLFALLVALVSPEFVSNLFFMDQQDGVSRYAASVGLIFGLFIGAAVSGFACLLAVVLRLIRLRIDLALGRKPEGGGGKA
jgi:hypothetical protein